MQTLSVEQLDYIEKATARWEKAGVTHVKIVVINDEHVCKYCRITNKTLIPLSRMQYHCEHCSSQGGCRCRFQPIYPLMHITDDSEDADNQ